MTELTHPMLAFSCWESQSFLNLRANEGIWITNSQGQSQLLRVDSVVICAGQESEVELIPSIGDAPDGQYHLIGGAKLDAKRAIREGITVGI